MRILQLVIKGRPITKKNSQMFITTKRGQKFLIPKKAYRDYEKDACLQILQNGRPDAIFEDVQVSALYWMPNKRGKPDLIGLMESTSDILEKVNVIDNDRQIHSWDGSRIMGVDPENPRVEITIRWG